MDEDDYVATTELDWARYEFSTIVYDYHINDEAARRIDLLFERLYRGR